MPVDFNLAVDIINRHFSVNGLGSYSTTLSEINWPQAVKEFGEICSIDPDNNICERYFNSLSADLSEERELTLYHFRPISIAINILERGILQASHLTSHSRNDEQELVHFFRQIGHPLGNSSFAIPPELLARHGSFSTIEELRQKVHILCFTTSSDDPLFWRYYADDNKGVCLVLRYRPVADERSLSEILPLYHLRKMVYDTEDEKRFSFLIEMNEDLLRRVGFRYMITPIPKYSPFYK